jgi:hypothetical protein
MKNRSTFLAILATAFMLSACAPAAQKPASPTVKPVSGTRISLMVDGEAPGFSFSAMSLRFATAFQKAGYTVTTEQLRLFAVNNVNYNDTMLSQRNAISKVAEKANSEFVVIGVLAKLQKTDPPFLDLTNKFAATGTGVFTVTDRSGKTIDRIVIEKTSAAPTFLEAAKSAEEAVFDEGFQRTANVMNP